MSLYVCSGKYVEHDPVTKPFTSEEIDYETQILELEVHC